MYFGPSRLSSNHDQQQCLQILLNSHAMTAFLHCITRNILQLFSGGAEEVAQLLLGSAEATVALGQPSVYGPDNIANKTNDIQGSSALAAAVMQSSQAQSVINAAFPAAIASALNESTEAAAVLIATAMLLDQSNAVETAAQGIKQVRPLFLHHKQHSSGACKLPGRHDWACAYCHFQACPFNTLAKLPR